MSRFFDISKSLLVDEVEKIPTTIRRAMINLFRYFFMPAEFVMFFGNRIISAATPGIATGNSFYGEPSAAEEAVFFKCFNAIGRTRRGVAARRRQPRRNGHLIEADKQHEEISERSSHGAVINDG